MPPIVEPGPGPARARVGRAQGRGPRAGGTFPGRGTVCPRGDADAGQPAGPDREGHVQQWTCLGGGFSAESPTGGAGVSAWAAVTGLDKLAKW